MVALVLQKRNRLHHTPLAELVDALDLGSSLRVRVRVPHGVQHDGQKNGSTAWPGHHSESTPFAEALIKLRKQLRIERDGYSIIVGLPP